jgi:hypothetical protein
MMSKKDAPILPRQTGESRRLKQLPWPRNLFGGPIAVEELIADNARQSDRCACGCHKTHGHNVCQTQSNSYGFKVIWFWSDACKSRWNRNRTLG